MNNAQLIDEIREFEAKAHGKRMELCQRLGDRQGMQLHQREMYALIQARKAAAEVELETPQVCYFDAKGAVDGLNLGGAQRA